LERVVRGPSWTQLLGEGVAVAVVAGMVGRVIADGVDPASQTTDVAQIAARAGRTGIVWAAVAASLAVWLTLRRGEHRALAPRLLMALLIGVLAGGLGGAIFQAPLSLLDPPVLRSTHAPYAIGALAVTGALVGAMLGALWQPRAVATGFLTGLATAALVRFFVYASDWSRPNLFDAVLETGLYCVAIVGCVLAALIAVAPPDGAAGPDAAR
jgi:hypothetical protein